MTVLKELLKAWEYHGFGKPRELKDLTEEKVKDQIAIIRRPFPNSTGAKGVVMPDYDYLDYILASMVWNELNLHKEKKK